MKRFLFYIILLISTTCEARAPQLSIKDIKAKSEEILKLHALYKNITPALAERILKNFIEELDPAKTYFIESDIQKWLFPSEEMSNAVIESFSHGNFYLFFQIHQTMLKAIERRQKIEKELLSHLLPPPPSQDEFKNNTWTTSENELFEKNAKIKSFQQEIAIKLNNETKEKFLKRIEKCRLLREGEIKNNSNEENKAFVLSTLLKAFCSSLDSHTAYFTPTEAQTFAIQVQQKLFGIGALLKDDLNGLLVTRILEKSPAEKILKQGDIIIAVNKEPILGLDPYEAIDLIRGEKGTKVELTIVRNSENIDVDIIRDEIIIEEGRLETSFEPYADGIIPSLRLFSFYHDGKNSSASDIKNYLESIKKKYKIYGVILDLRSNAGGLLPQAIEVAGLFISKGIVASVKDNSDNLQHLRLLENKCIFDGPLVILINKASASASEIVAQALQDYGRAIVVGDEFSFGKGSFQSFTLDTSKQNKINDQGEYKVTRGRYYTVSGKSPQLQGVKSNIVIPGILSEMEIGEKYAKYPLEADEIAPNFDDNLSDIPPAHRKKLSVLYKFNLQKKLTNFTSHLELLKRNSQKRIQENKNYQKFLSSLKNNKIENELIDTFNQNDFQYQETINILKDLIFLNELNSTKFT